MSTHLQPRTSLHHFLVNLKISLSLLREVLVEFKDLLSIITVIIFFALGVYEALHRLLKP